MPVTPRCLYLQQIQDRLGPEAVLHVTTAAQRAGDVKRIEAALRALPGPAAK
jgi:hypothetical protein